ncbi:MAG: hypothetical protein GY771_10385 [bacterium]|nr:hypothetical protein [bacterium]
MGKYFSASGFLSCAALTLIIAVATPAGDYIGSETCGMCHADQLDSWAGTPHADSIKVLEENGAADSDECLSCHTTGMGSDAYEKAVSCEACHGAGSDHFDAGGGAGTIVMDIDESTCTKCHTSDWSADWNYEEYLKTGTHE